MTATREPYTGGRLAILGATGFTGRLVCDEARRAGMPLRLVGRREDALDALAQPGDEVRVADARDREGLAHAFDGTFAVVTTAGPFGPLGHCAVEAAIDVGAHYLDTTGEQEYARLVYERYGDLAAGRGLVLLTAFGFDYVPGDLAAALAAERVEHVEEVVVAYSAGGMVASRGTLRTIPAVLGRPHVALVDGRLVPSSFGATARRVAFPSGEHGVVEWGGTEPLTVPRHTGARTVRSYLRAPRAAARVTPLLRLAAPLLGRLPWDGPPPGLRRRARFAVVAEARGPGGDGRATLTGHDVYGLTARLVVEGVRLLAAGEARGAGALAPAEAFDARGLVAALAPLLEAAPAAEP